MRAVALRRLIVALRVASPIVAPRAVLLIAALLVVVTHTPARSQPNAQPDTSAVARDPLELSADARAELERIIDTRGFTRGLPV